MQFASMESGPGPWTMLENVVEQVDDDGAGGGVANSMKAPRFD